MSECVSRLNTACVHFKCMVCFTLICTCIKQNHVRMPLQAGFGWSSGSKTSIYLMPISKSFLC